MPAISDSSPLILYASIGSLNLLRSVFAEIMIPEAVWQEVVVEGAGRAGATEVAHTPWIRRVAVTRSELARTLLSDLGPGESEAIVLATEFEPPQPLLLDDRKARRFAHEHGLLVLGSAGVLLLAKEQQIISTIRPFLDDLRANGLFLSDQVADELLVTAGELPSQ